MARQRSDLGHGWVLPHHNLIKRIAVRTDNLVTRTRESQVANLTSGVNAVETGAAKGIPESDASICRAATAGEETVLVRTPSDGLYSRRVLGKLVNWLRLVLNIPNEELIVISTGGKMGGLIEGPLEATNLLLVSLQERSMLLLRTYVAKVNGTIATATCQSRPAPSQGTNSDRVTGHRAELFALDRVPDLDLSLVGANGKM